MIFFFFEPSTDSEFTPDGSNLPASFAFANPIYSIVGKIASQAAQNRASPARQALFHQKRFVHSSTASVPKGENSGNKDADSASSTLVPPAGHNVSPGSRKWILYLALLFPLIFGLSADRSQDSSIPNSSQVLQAKGRESAEGDEVTFSQLRDSIRKNKGSAAVQQGENGASVLRIGTNTNDIEINLKGDAALLNQYLSQLQNCDMRIVQEASGKIYIEFEKRGNLTEAESAAISRISKLIYIPFDRDRVDLSDDEALYQKRIAAEKKLKKLGISIYSASSSAETYDWSHLAGYDHIKEQIEDTILLALQHPETFDKISKLTRKFPETCRPKAVLFEGPPGCGKTSTARIISRKVNIPLVYVPLESIISKWYGESERKLSEIFDLCTELGNCLIFVDEIDALGLSRDSELHEATRRVLSVLLRKLDGFHQNDKTILIGATNRKQDLDSALLSRFDLAIKFGYPDVLARKEIFKMYASHLTEPELDILAKESANLSGRNIKDLCEAAERRWASTLIRTKNIKNPDLVSPPPVNFYADAIEQKRQTELVF